MANEQVFLISFQNGRKELRALFGSCHSHGGYRDSAECKVGKCLIGSKSGVKRCRKSLTVCLANSTVLFSVNVTFIAALPSQLIELTS
jgi:hypothetical protein